MAIYAFILAILCFYFDSNKWI